MKVLRVVLALMLALSVLSVMSFASSANGRVDKALMVGGYHDLRTTGLGGSQTGVNGPSYALCNYCHVAHKFAADSGLGATGPATLLWNHTLSSSTAYTAYTSWTLKATDLASLQGTGVNADLNNPSIMCMSCHDGTVALNSSYTGAIGSVGTGMPSSMVINPADANKTHPINFTYDATLANAAGMKVPAGTNGVDSNTNPVIPLFSGKMQCSTCHEPHTNSHLLFRNFNAVYTTTNGSWCLYCHSDGSGYTG
jgi:hypothetical protein